jgi:hypothetical protein
MRRDRRLEKIAMAFAEAVSEGNLREAEAWVAIAQLSASRAPDLPPRERRLHVVRAR